MRELGKSFGGVRHLLAMAGLGGLLYGIDFGTIAAAMPYIKALGMFSDAQVSWIVGAVLFGGILATLTAGFLCDRCGRKRMIVASAAMFLVAIPVVCLSGGVLWTMMAGRVLQGMSAGYMAVVMPMYLTEILPPEIRGRGTGVFQFCLWVGLVGAALIGLLLAGWLGAADAAGIAAETKNLAWKLNFWWTMAPVAVLFVGSLFLPESPVWIERFQISDLRSQISGQGVSDINPEASGVNPEASSAKHEASSVKSEASGVKPEVSSVKSEASGVKTGTRGADSLLQRKYVIPFLLAVLVLTFNKTTGMSSITSYAVVIFNKAGFTGSLGNVGDLAIKFTSMAMTLVAATLIDRKGRTWLLRVGTAGMTVGLVAIGTVLLAIERFGVTATPTTGLVCLGAFVFMEIFYSLGPSICVWLVLSELMPTRIRANGMSIAMFMNQFVAWGLASSFLPWVNRWGWFSMFFFFAANGALYFITALFIPETKGKSLEELETLFERKE